MGSWFHKQPASQKSAPEQPPRHAMGGSGQSKEPAPQESAPEQPPRQVFAKKPWRKTKGWGKSVRDDLKAEIASCRPNTKLPVNSFNIVLMGQIGSGKSSFFNSINSIFKEKLTAAKAPVGRREKSLTRQFMLYTFGKDISIRIGDTMGVQVDTTEVDVRNILSVVDGHVPHGHTFTLDEEFYCKSKGYIANPTITGKAHCVAIVIDAHQSFNMHENVVRKLKSLAEGLLSRKVPFVVLLTHLDNYCEEVKDDITKTFHVIALRELLDKVSAIVLGLPPNQIHPVINYQDDVELDDNMDILLLYALRTMVDAAQGHLETIESLQSKQPSENSSKLNYSQEEQGFISPPRSENMPMEIE